MRAAIPLVAGAMAGAAITALLAWVAVEHIAIPRVIAQQEERCQLASESLAAAAVAKEQLRQFHAAERVTQRFIEQSQAAADDAKARQDLLELEIGIYAEAMRDGGGVCALDAAALELGGVRPPPGQDRPGGR